jgi:hypothetical protein
MLANFKRREGMAALTFGIFVWDVYRPTGLGQLASFLALVVCLVAAVVGLFSVRVDGWRGVGASLACLVAIPAGVVVGHKVRDEDFRYRRLPRYEQTIAQLRGAMRAANDIETLSTEPSLAYRAFVRRIGDGGIRVEFLWGVGFPVKHVCYVYTSSGEASMGATGYWRYRQLDTNWFEASD